MAKKFKKGDSFANQLKYGLEKKHLSFILGRSDPDPTSVLNSPASMNDSVTNSSYAQRILRENIHRVLKVSTNSSKYWTSGMSPGQYFSSGESVGQFVFVYEDIVYLVIGQSGVNNRIDKFGSILTRNPPTDKSGEIATVDGIQYCAIAAIEDPFINKVSDKYIPMSSFDDVKRKFNGSTSISSKMSNICGVGHAGTTGNCCLYRSTSGFDAIAGSTYAAGDFYKCICTECYKCVEIAEAMDMKYIFNKNSAGSTGSDCQCDSGTFPTDCGACGCTMDWNYNSKYSTIINNRNISSESSLYKNAAIAQHHAENYSGCILSVNAYFRNIPISERLLAPEFEEKYKNDGLYLPLKGSCFREALVPIICTYDSSNKRYTWEGFDVPKEYGSEYTSVSVDADTFSSYFPGINEDLSKIIKINQAPPGGIPANMSNLFDTALLIAVQVSSKDISDVTGQKVFDHYSIGTLVTDNGESIYSGLAERQKVSTSLVTEFQCSKYGDPMAALTASDIPSPGVKMTNEVGSNQIFENTRENLIVAYEGSIATGSLTLPLQCAFPDRRIGDVFTNSVDNQKWTINSINSRPLSFAGEPINLTKSEFVMHKQVTINLDQNPENSRTFRVEVLLGSDPCSNRITAS